jgi:molybdopterin-biosynthesis enzyme MoeA-like protein
MLRRNYAAEITAAQLRMAEVPEGSRLLGEEACRLPIVACANVFIFPGVPETVRRKFTRIRETFREAPYVVRRIYLRCDEGEIAADLCNAVDRFPFVQIGSYPILHNPDHNVLVTLESKQAEEVEEALRYLLARLAASFVVRAE